MKVNERYLHRYNVVGESVPTAPPSVNHILILDRSGSMYHLLDKVIDDVQHQINILRQTDHVSVGWFSSEGQFGWVVKGASLADRENINRTLDKYRNTVGATCFSEILEDAKKSLSDLRAFSDRFCLMLFTDGYPVVRNVAAEESAILSTLKDLSKDLSLSLFIGYGEGYNRDLMSRMAQSAGGMLCHASNITDIVSHLNLYVSSSESAEKRSLVTVPANAEAVFAFNGATGDVVILDNTDGSVGVPSNFDRVYFLSATEADTALSEDEAYAAALVLSQLGRVDDSIAVVGEIGDKYYADALSNSFTNNELGTVENKLALAIKDRRYRFVAGKVDNCVPDPAVPCLLDVLDILTSGGAEFLPYHKDFVYQRTGRPSKTKDGYPKFVADDGPVCPLSALVWHESRLNLSVRATIHGHVDLGDEAVEFGLDSKFRTYVYRNYTIIKDGKPNVDNLILQMPIDTYKKVSALVPNSIKTNSDGTFTLDVLSIPVINRDTATQYNSLNSICTSAISEKTLEARQKVLNHFFKGYKEDYNPLVQFSDVQAEFLKSKGIGGNGFSPEKELEEATDFYITKELSIDISGLKSLPKVEDVIAKMQSGKALTPVQQLIANGISYYESLQLDGVDRSEVANRLAEELKSVRGQLFALRSAAQRTKFAVILARQNFKELGKPIKDETIEYVFGSYTFNLKLKEVAERV